MSAFTFVPEFGAQKQLRPEVSSIRFGDGYEQRASKGLNSQKEVWSLQFANRDETEANQIEEFFITRNGVTAFEWTPPGSSTEKKFVCREWGRVPVRGNLYSLTATFEQVYGP